jgi:myo-inositol-1(or 4)-monophosphatase
MDFSPYLPVAQQAARLAGQEIRQYLGKPIAVQFKGHRDPVTEVDLRCQAIIRNLLLERFPEHGFLGEEGNSTGLDLDFIWVVDPLDGTKNFSHGYPTVAVSIALVFQNQPVLGVIYDVSRDDLFHTLTGQGAYLNGQTISVSDRDDLSLALLVTGFAAGIDVEFEVFLDLEKRSQGVRRDGSAALDFCSVAAGRLDGFFQLNLSPWDVAAGILLVREAGGMVTDYRGRDYRLNLQHRRGNQVLASNVRLHRSLVDRLSRKVDEIESQFP